MKCTKPDISFNRRYATVNLLRHLPGLKKAELSSLRRSLGSLISEAMPVGLSTSVTLAISLSAAAAITIWSATRRIPELDIMRLLRAE